MHLTKFPTVLIEVLFYSLYTLSSLDHFYYITNILSSTLLLHLHRACFPDFLNHTLLLSTHFLQLTNKLIYSPLNLVKLLNILDFYRFRWTIEESRVFHVSKGTVRGF
jgi:hypothetical protein